jgi:hypothetical protein
VLSAGREGVLVSIVHCMSILGISYRSFFDKHSGPREVHRLCALPLYALLLEIVVAASQVAVCLGYILLHARRPYLTVSLLNPTSPTTPGSTFPSILTVCHSGIRVLAAAAACANHATVYALLIFHHALLQGKAPSS